VSASRVTVAVVLVIGMLLPALGRVTLAAAQASVVSFTTAEVAPADAVAYIVTTTDERSEQWRLADTLLDRAGVGEAIDQAMAEGMGDEELPLDAFLGGEVAVVASQTAVENIAAESMGSADLDAMLEGLGMATPEADAAGPEPQGFAVVLDARAPDTAWTGIQESVSDQPSEESTYEGTTILYVPPASSDDQGMAAARVGDHILIATAPEDLHALIDTSNGTTPSLATVPEFTATREALPQEFLTFAYVTSLSGMGADFGPFAPAASQLTTDAYSGMTIAADEAGFRMETIALPAAGEALPVGAANFESELVSIAPDDTIFFASAADLGATGVLDALGATLISFALGFGGMMDPSATPAADASGEDFIAEQFEAAAGLIGINLQTELFQQFEGEYGGWLSGNLEAGNLSGVFASMTADPERVTNALMQLSFLIQGASGSETPLTSREVGGGQVYVIELGDEAGSTLEFGVVGDYLVIGSGAAVDRFGDAAGGALADNVQFQAVMDTLPVEHNGLFYLDLTQAIPLAQAAAEESEDLGLGGFSEMPDASESCADYETQEAAQEAYDAGESGTFDLDQDFDGQVCEDFFTTDEMASGDGESSEAADAFANIDYSAIKAFASVAYDEDGARRSSSILYISE
jgi:hypothetical protein